MKQRIAIIGAGISGLTLAQKLKDAFEVVVFEKSRGVGGRMSTRFADPFYFDHGVQYFTCRHEKFREFIHPYLQNGTISEWDGKTIILEQGKEPLKRIKKEPYYVVCPTMNHLCKIMKEGVQIQLLTEVSPLNEKEGQWILSDTAGNQLGHFDWIISTAPPAQTIRLLNRSLQPDSPLHQSRLEGCYALMIGFQKPWDRDWISAKVRNNPVKWIAVNSTKPARNKEVTALLVHSCNEWSQKHIDQEVSEVQKILTEQFEIMTGIDCQSADYIACHRWRYAIINDGIKSGFYLNLDQKMAATSDWASSSRIENVWLDAMGLADDLLTRV